VLLKQITLTLPPFAAGPFTYEKRRSVPVTAAVIAPACTLPPPAPFGEENSIVPPSRVISRPPAKKRKSVFEPTRVMVRSGNLNSARDSSAVFRAVWPLIISPIVAGLVDCISGKSDTIFTVLVTSACLKGSACAAVGSAAHRTRVVIR
jgi:hypothetical protein